MNMALREKEIVLSTVINLVRRIIVKTSTV